MLFVFHPWWQLEPEQIDQKSKIRQTRQIPDIFTHKLKKIIKVNKSVNMTKELFDAWMQWGKYAVFVKIPSLIFLQFIQTGEILIGEFL